jgi:hypothetical protein
MSKETWEFHGIKNRYHRENLDRAFAKISDDWNAYDTDDITRKMTWLRTLSPNELLQATFGDIHWDSHHVAIQPYPSTHETSIPNENLWDTHPFIIKDLELTPYGNEIIATVNRYYASIHGVKEVKGWHEDKTGVINHTLLFNEGYALEYTTRSYTLGGKEVPAKTIQLIKPTDWREYFDKKAYATLPHKQEIKGMKDRNEWKTNPVYSLWG